VDESVDLRSGTVQTSDYVAQPISVGSASGSVARAAGSFLGAGGAGPLQWVGHCG